MVINIRIGYSFITNIKTPIRPSVVVEWIDLKNEEKGVQVSLSIHILGKDWAWKLIF